jgi:hypothetical protein
LVSADDGGADLHQRVDVADGLGVGSDLLQGSGEHAVQGVAGAGQEPAQGASETVRSCCPTGPGERQAAADVLDLERLVDEVDTALGEFGARCVNPIDMNAHALIDAVLQAGAQVVG